MDHKPTSKVPILKVKGRQQQKMLDAITTEAPLEISISLPRIQPKIFDKSISITMRTPGADTVLALGFLYNEGIINKMDEVEGISTQENKIHIVLNHRSEAILTQLNRHFYTSSSCGVCGKASIEAIQTIVQPIEGPAFRLPLNTLLNLPIALREAQQIFEQTGGIHAAGLFALDGTLIHISEDVGRHNAVDKLVGYMLTTDQRLDQSILVLSGRISFELVHKAAVARIPMIAAIGAPSTLAIDTAEAYDITLIGFLKAEGFNCYNGEHRLAL